MKILKNSNDKLCISSEDKLLQLGSLTQLAAPTDVSVASTTASWSEVTNATTYALYIDGVLFGQLIVWINPIQNGSNLTTIHVYGATKSGSELTLE